MNTAPQLLSAFTLGEDVRVKQAFLAENGYVLLLREDNSERLVLLGDDAIFFTPLSKSLPVAFFPVQGSEPGAFPDPLRCAESGLSPGLLGGKYIVTGWLTDFQRTQSPWSNRHAVTSSFYSLGNEMSHAYDWLP